MGEHSPHVLKGKAVTTFVRLSKVLAVAIALSGCATWDVPDWPKLQPGMCEVPDNYDGNHPYRTKVVPCEDGGDGGPDAMSGEDGGIFDALDAADAGNFDASSNDASNDVKADTGADVVRDMGSIDDGAIVDGAIVDGSNDVGQDAVIDGDGGYCDVSRSPVDTPCLINDAYGVFVSPKGSDNGSGTKAAPFQTIRRAMLAAKSAGKRVYVCDDGDFYREAVTVDSTVDGSKIYGGFECAGWTYATERRANVSPDTGVALTVSGLTIGLTVENMDFEAANATTPGASSIAAIVDSSQNVILRRVWLVGGRGAFGQAGVDGAKGDDGQMVAQGQLGTNAACPGVSIQNGGFWGAANSCNSRGGSGGTAFQGGTGTSGSTGTPDMNVDPPNINNGGPAGAPGAPGSVGIAGLLGQQVSTTGTFSAGGYVPAPPAGSGTDGSTGQGGGGGGASNGVGVCTGASGGAGGMGGCGGKAATGGRGGGASVALLTWNSSGVLLDACWLVASAGGPGGAGGNGGLGGLGQDGAHGGAGYQAGDGGTGDAGGDAGSIIITGGGKGGRGGNGGNGGSGAGGNGGPSYALVYKGSSPSRSNGTTFTPGTAGVKGIGGTAGNAKAPDGIAGSAAEEFGAP
jgi:hypothetical protein